MELSQAKPIELGDKDLFDTFFKNYPPEMSEFTFTNLFMWRNYYNFLFLESDKHLILFSRDYFKKQKSASPSNNDKLFFLPPIGPHPVELMFQIFERFNTAEFHRVPQEVVSVLTNHDKYSSLNLEVIEDRNNWDYVYEVEDLKTLPGNRYRQNRRWLKKFTDTYKFEFQIISEELVDKVKRLQKEWWLLRGGEEDSSLEEEQKAIYEALDNFTALGFKGALLCCDDKCAAYTFGEMLNPNTLVIHIEKAHMDYEGAYQAINNLFLKNCCENKSYVNREQDLGILGLRRAKESYKPIRMIEKSIIYRKQ
ncbi:MAG: DUF2156 domain-containing protein [Promethearchaeota archaeon]|jgi:hypothetical protein